jgi:YggT family protein
MSQVVCLLAYFLTLAIIARAILSWFQLDPRSPLIQALDSITSPILDPIRRIMPRIAMIDLSPIVAILLLNFISSVVQQQLG